MRTAVVLILISFLASGCDINGAIEGGFFEDSSGTISASISSQNGGDSAEGASFKVTVSAAESMELSWKVLNKSNTEATSDFVVSSGVQTIDPSGGENSFTIDSIDDDLYEGDESFVVEFTSTGLESPVVSESFVVSDNEGEPTVQFVQPTSSAFENDGVLSVNFTVTQITEENIYITITVTGTAVLGDDFQMETTVVIPGGNSVGVHTISLIDDDIGGETIENIGLEIASVHVGDSLPAQIGGQKNHDIDVNDGGPGNDAPTINFSTCSLGTTVDLAYSCQAELNDEDAGDTHTWSIGASHTCTWLTMPSVVTGELTGTPGSGDLGSCLISLQSHDGTVLSGEYTATLTVVPLADAPVVSGDYITQSLRPTWSWNSGGNGIGTFRYKLDDSDLSSGATETSSLNFTPSSDLVVGVHTLFVQEQNVGGHWSASGSFEVTVTENYTGCDSGDPESSCTINIDKTFTDKEGIYIPGNLIIENNSTLATSATEFVSIYVGGLLLVRSGSHIKGNLKYIEAASMTIEAGASIDVTGLGFPGGGAYQNGQGPGGGLYNGGFNERYVGTGAGHGGQGGYSKYSSAVNSSSGPSYGSAKEPTDLGSGGAGTTSPTPVSGDGGGAVRITVTNTLTVNGAILANGTNSTTTNGLYNSGAGSGGSVWLDVGTLAGTEGSAVISANGGNPSSGSHFGGAGAGGRIAIYYSSDSYAGTVTAYGGTSGYQHGGAGTVLRQQKGTSTYSLKVSTAGVPTPRATDFDLSGSVTFNEFLVESGATLLVPDNLNITLPSQLNLNGELIGVNGVIDIQGDLNVSNVGGIDYSGTLNLSMTGDLVIAGRVRAASTDSLVTVPGDITVSSGGVLDLTNTADPVSDPVSAPNITATNMTVDGSVLGNVYANISNNLSVNTGGQLSADERGYSGGIAYQPGQGPGGGAYNSSSGTGGSHGGEGARASHNATVTAAYGSTSNPVSFGSGGGGAGSSAAASGRGGGAIRLVVGNTLTLDGTITTEGANQTTSNGIYRAGGSAGGSVWIDTVNFVGSDASALITANGGEGGGSSIASGAGAGGRIAVFYNSKSWSGSYEASGGTGGYQAAGAGTIYLKDKGAETETLRITNAAATSRATQIDLGSNLTFPEFILSGGALLSLPDGATVVVNNDYTTSGTIKGNDLIFTVNGDLNASSGGFDLTGNLTLTVSGNLLTSGTIQADGTDSVLNVTGDITVSNGGVIDLTNTADPVSDPVSAPNITATNMTVDGSVLGNVYANISNNLSVNTGGQLSADERGYSGGIAYQPGQGPGGGAYNSSSGTGGSHGGEGARASHNATVTAAYGSTSNPVSFGSGGGGAGSSAAASGRGGGAVRLVVGNTLTLDGIISTKGANQTTSNGIYRAGGSAGGSVWIDTVNFVGSDASALITANGGEGGGSSIASGAGAGGRIAVFYNSKSWSGSFEASGGTGGYQAAGAGTIYLYNKISTDKELQVLSGAATSRSTTTDLTDLTFSSLTLDLGRLALADAAVLTVDSAADWSGVLVANNGNLTFNNNLTLSSGGVVSSSGLDLSVSGALVVDGTIQGNATINATTLTISTTGSVVADGLGGSGGVQSDGVGLGAGKYHYDGGSGAGHGGSGGQGKNQSTVGGTYGSSTFPTTAGSGGGAAGSGGYAVGGYGGGVLRIIVTGTLTQDGLISANGTMGTNPYGYPAGGGSGGSVWVTADTFAGTDAGASVEVNGGDGIYASASRASGGGGGGRIHIDVSTNTYSGTVSANGGAAGHDAGAAGSIVGP